jgi:thiol-disulfide isomerase/thioredoxin/outer membrane lipoprotein-sorting protein
MIKRISSLSLAFAVVLIAAGQARSQTNPSAETVMQKVAKKLAAVKLLGYKYNFEYSYPARDSRTVANAQAYFDLQPADQKDGFKFQFIGDERSSVYNGSERFIADKKSKKLYVESSPSFNSFGDIFLLNGPLALKYALPTILKNAAIQKKLSAVTISGREYYVLEFSLTKAAITSIGEIVEVRADQNSTYRVTVDKRTFLPVEVLQTNDKNDETVKCSFADITEKPVLPKSLSWYFSSYKNEYQLEKKEKLTLIEAGKISPSFKLAGYGSPVQVSLDQYKGKLVLLEFWITHCGFCVAAVPKLNAISQRFAEKGLQIISINMYDPAETIEFFKNKNKPEYMILTGGESIAKVYGVEAYPAIVLVDRNGKVVYSSSGLFEKELEAAIIAGLQE